MPSNELIVPEDTALIEKKVTELGNSIISRSDADRQTAKDIYNLIRDEIAKVEDDYQRAKDVYDTAFRTISQEENEQIKTVMLCKLGKPPYKKSIVGYLEQLNRALEMSIKSSDSVVDLMTTIARAATAKRVDIENVNIDNRALLLDEVIREEEEAKRLNNNKG